MFSLCSAPSLPFLFFHVGLLVMRRFAVHCTLWLWRLRRRCVFETDAWPRSFVLIGRRGTTCQAEARCRRACVRTEQSCFVQSFAQLVLCFCKERGDVSSQYDDFRRDFSFCCEAPSGHRHVCPSAGAHSTGHFIHDAVASVRSRTSTAMQRVLAFESLISPKA